MYNGGFQRPKPVATGKHGMALLGCSFWQLVQLLNTCTAAQLTSPYLCCTTHLPGQSVMLLQQMHTWPSKHEQWLVATFNSQQVLGTQLVTSSSTAGSRSSSLVDELRVREHVSVQWAASARMERTRSSPLVTRWCYFFQQANLALDMQCT